MVQMKLSENTENEREAICLFKTFLGNNTNTIVVPRNQHQLTSSNTIKDGDIMQANSNKNQKRL